MSAPSRPTSACSSGICPPFAAPLPARANVRAVNDAEDAMKSLLTIGAVAGAAAAFAAPVLAQCGDGWMGTNLPATPGGKAALASAYGSAHPGFGTASPLPGHTYYGSYSGTRYAVATFGAYPTVFKTDRQGRWH